MPINERGVYIPTWREVWQPKFMARVYVDKQTGCWLQLATSFRLDGNYRSFRQAAWVLFKDPYPPRIILTRCHERGCCAPDHLYGV